MIIITVAQAAAALYVLVACALILNRMSYRTHPAAIASFIGFTVGAGLALVTAIGHASVVVCVLIGALACYIATNGRKVKP